MSDADVIAGEFSLPTSSLVGRRVVRSRHRDRDFGLRRALLAADLVSLWLALALAMSMSVHRTTPIPDSLWILLTFPAWALLFRAYGLYQRPIRRFEPTYLDDIASLFHVTLIGTVGLWFFYQYLPVLPMSFERVWTFWILAFPLVAGMRFVVRKVNLRLRGPERVFVVAPADDVKMLQRKLGNHPEYEMALVGAATDEDAADELGLGLNTRLDDIELLLASHQVDHLVVQLDSRYLPQEDVVKLMRACSREGIRFGAFPKEKNLLLPGVEINHIEGMGLLTFHPPVLSRTSKAMKRTLDLVVSALLCVLFAPVMALIALAVVLDSKGGAFYRQVRVGKDGHRFRLIKFRTMEPGADRKTAELMEHSSDPDWLIIANDPRVTRVGRFLRHTSLDELPQLWNVLKGEMSMVGPRPLSECDDERVHGWQRHRLDLVPGITGYWQVLGRNNIPFREMVEIDYAYVASWSMLHDLKLLVRTVPAVLRRRGAN